MNGSVSQYDKNLKFLASYESGKGLVARPLALEDAGKDANYVGKRGSRWIDARHIRLGDMLLSPSGMSATVTGLTIRIERVRVYNFTVDKNTID